MSRVPPCYPSSSSPFLFLVALLLGPFLTNVVYISSLFAFFCAPLSLYIRPFDLAFVFSSYLIKLFNVSQPLILHLRVLMCELDRNLTSSYYKR